MNSILQLFLFIFIFVIISLTGFTLVRTIHDESWDNHFPEISIGISGSILSVLSIFLSVSLSFIIIYLWTNYNDTVSLIQKQMDDILVAYNTMKLLNNDVLTEAFRNYVYKKITFQELQTVIYQYNDNSVIYQQVLTLLNSTYYRQFNERNAVSPEIWIVIIIGVITVIIGTWFVKSPFLLHLYLIISVAAVLGGLVYLVYYYDSLDCYTCIEQQLRQQLISKI